MPKFKAGDRVVFIQKYRPVKGTVVDLKPVNDRWVKTLQRVINGEVNHYKPTQREMETYRQRLEDIQTRYTIRMDNGQAVKFRRSDQMITI